MSAYSRPDLHHLSPFVFIFGANFDCPYLPFTPITFLSSLIVVPASFSTRLCFHCGLLPAQSWWRLGVSRILLDLFSRQSIIIHKLKNEIVEITYVSVDLFLEGLFKSLLLLLPGVAFLLALASVGLNFGEMVVHCGILQLIFHGQILFESFTGEVQGGLLDRVVVLDDSVVVLWLHVARIKEGLDLAPCGAADDRVGIGATSSSSWPASAGC